jgi:hypothetical protein
VITIDLVPDINHHHFAQALRDGAAVVVPETEHMSLAARQPARDVGRRDA